MGAFRQHDLFAARQDRRQLVCRAASGRPVVGAAEDQRRHGAPSAAPPAGRTCRTRRRPQSASGFRADRRPDQRQRALRRVGLSGRRRGTASGRSSAASPARASPPLPRAPTTQRPADGATRARTVRARARRSRAPQARPPFPSRRMRVRCRVAPCGSEPRTSRTTSRSPPALERKARMSASTSSAICGTVHCAGSPASERPLAR